MIKVKWHTNLDDVMKYEKFPSELPFRPMVGDLVASNTKYRFGHNHMSDYRQLHLKVVACTINGDTIEAELHLIPSRYGQDSVSSFMKWYPGFRRGD